MSHDENKEQTATDPVCGMRVEKGSAVAQVTHKDRIYYLCSTDCKEKFLKDPERFAGMK